MLLLLTLGLIRGVLVPEERATNALRDAGYTNIHITDKKILFVGLRGCDGKDAVGFTASANMPTNEKVANLIVCMGILKGATIRHK